MDDEFFSHSGAVGTGTIIPETPGICSGSPSDASLEVIHTTLIQYMYTRIVSYPGFGLRGASPEHQVISLFNDPRTVR